MRCDGLFHIRNDYYYFMTEMLLWLCEILKVPFNFFHEHPAHQMLTVWVVFHLIFIFRFMDDLCEVKNEKSNPISLQRPAIGTRRKFTHTWWTEHIVWGTSTICRLATFDTIPIVYRLQFTRPGVGPLDWLHRCAPLVYASYKFWGYDLHGCSSNVLGRPFFAQ